MTLKQQVEDPRSPLRQFLDQKLPDTKAVRAQFRSATASMTTELLAPVKTVATPVGGNREYPSDEVGHAASIRLALLFSADRSLATRRLLCHPTTGEEWPTFIELSERTVSVFGRSAGFTPWPQDRERELLSLCYLGGLFDQLHRAGPRDGMPLLAVPPDAPVDDLIRDLVPAPCIDDLLHLVEHARHPLAALAAEDVAVTVAPTFTGSVDVGGADADVLVESTLLELKTRGKLELQQRHLHQVVTYALLDYDDAYGIDTLALYSARHAALVSWPLDDVLAWMGGRPVGVAALRAELREHMSAANRATCILTYAGDWELAVEEPAPTPEEPRVKVVLPFRPAGNGRKWHITYRDAGDSAPKDLDPTTAPVCGARTTVEAAAESYVPKVGQTLTELPDHLCWNCRQHTWWRGDLRGLT